MKYKCLLSGTVIEFTNEVDIKSMKNHPQYEVVQEIPEEVVDKSPQTAQKKSYNKG